MAVSPRLLRCRFPLIFWSGREGGQCLNVWLCGSDGDLLPPRGMNRTGSLHSFEKNKLQVLYSKFLTLSRRRLIRWTDFLHVKYKQIRSLCILVAVDACVIHNHARCVADGSIAERKGSPCERDENSVDGQIKGYSGTNLSEVRHCIAYYDCFNCTRCSFWNSAATISHVCFLFLWLYLWKHACCYLFLSSPTSRTNPCLLFQFF
jgi:hypothetical protein